MNVFDKSLLFEMSFALMRRFASIEVPSPGHDAFAELWRRKLEGMPSEQSEKIDRVLDGLYGLTSIKDIRPAVFLDMAAFAREFFGSGMPPSAKDLTFQLFFSYLLPQFEGITEIERPGFGVYGGSGSRLSPVWARNPWMRAGRYWMDPHRFRRHHPKWHDGLRGENRKWDRPVRSTPRNIRMRPWSW